MASIAKGFCGCPVGSNEFPSFPVPFAQASLTATRRRRDRKTLSSQYCPERQRQGAAMPFLNREFLRWRRFAQEYEGVLARCGAYFERVCRRVPSHRQSISRKPRKGLWTSPIFPLFQRDLASPSEPRRLAFRHSVVSECPFVSDEANFASIGSVEKYDAISAYCVAWPGSRFGPFPSPQTRALGRLRVGIPIGDQARTTVSRRSRTG